MTKIAILQQFKVLVYQLDTCPTTFGGLRMHISTLGVV